MNNDPGRTVDVPRHLHDWAKERCSFLVTTRAMGIAKNDLLSLLAMAYAQGLSDAVEALEKSGVELKLTR